MLLELSSDPRVVRHIGLGRPWPPQLAEDVFESQLGRWAEHGFGWRAAQNASRELVGLVSLNFLEEGAAGLDPGEYEIGWWLKPSAWGRGLAVEGARSVLDESFGRLGAPSVVARIQPSNERSIRTARALGMSFDACTTGRCGETVEIYRVSADQLGADRPTTPSLR
jgi:RimJ/RimL family protein N-acetyltransferase